MDKRFLVDQYGQSLIIEKLCYPKGNELHTGIFLEIGAWDGMEISNTYYLEKCKGWSGLLVEPISRHAKDAMHNRWCKVWEGCVYDRDGDTDFLHVIGSSEMLSCIKEACHSKHLERIEREVSRDKQSIEMIKVPCRTINSLLDFHGMKKVDIMSLDCQTVDLRVLRAYDVKTNPCKVIIIDFNDCNKIELEDWFKLNGYDMYWKHGNADEYIFVNHSLKWSWESGVTPPGPL